MTFHLQVVLARCAGKEALLFTSNACFGMQTQMSLALLKRLFSVDASIYAGYEVQPSATHRQPQVLIMLYLAAAASCHKSSGRCAHACRAAPPWSFPAGRLSPQDQKLLD